MDVVPEYLDALERKPRVMDLGTQIGHGALRAFVMGDRGANNEDANADDIAQMARITHEALRAGALGFSTSRTALHKSKNGEYVPGTSAQPDELLGIAEAVARAGHGIFQMAAEHGDDQTASGNGCATSHARPVFASVSTSTSRPTNQTSGAKPCR